MKTKSIFVSLVVAAFAFALLSHCSPKKEDSTEEAAAEEHATGTTASEDATEPTFEVDKNFQDQLARVFKAYVSMKDAFVASDPAKVKSEAAETQRALAQVDMKLLNGAAHNDWMYYLGGMESSLKEIRASNDIEVQRKSFSATSDNLYKSIKAFGLGGTTAFYEFCPMAFNDEGGYWLSDQEKVLNPYFGDKMLSCGMVKEKLR